jgi:EAL domain-containing protein (putative c-di-GMP-specific phosphodiesterase class I)
VPVIAEGIETEAQAARLTELSCPLAQGYLYSRPLAPAAVPSHMSRQHAAPALPLPRSPEGAAESACQ